MQIYFGGFGPHLVNAGLHFSLHLWEGSQVENDPVQEVSVRVRWVDSVHDNAVSKSINAAHRLHVPVNNKQCSVGCHCLDESRLEES